MESTTVKIEKLVEGGWGLARRGSEVLFARGVVPGEEVKVRIEVHRKGYQKARVLEVVESAPERVEAPCPAYGTCGGCQFQHIGYEAQLRLKAAILKETLRRVGKLVVQDVCPLVPSPDPFGYRSAVRFVVFRERGTFELGFCRAGTNEPVSAFGCLLVPEGMRQVASCLRDRLAKQAKLPVRLDSIEVRWSLSTGSALLIHRTGPADRNRARALMTAFNDIPGLVGQVIAAQDGRLGQRWVDGQDWITDQLGDLTFRISDRSFMQANWSMAHVLTQNVGDWATPSPGMRILELYAGVGILGLPLARRGALVTEVEASPYALADARYTARVNHIGRSRFRRLQAEAMLERIGVGEYDLVMVDPPRTGLSDACLQGLARVGVPRLLYLSCDSPTLARDLSRFCAAGYRIVRVQPFDMFPQTAHLETLVELVR